MEQIDIFFTHHSREEYQTTLGHHDQHAVVDTLCVDVTATLAKTDLPHSEVLLVQSEEGAADGRLLLALLLERRRDHRRAAEDHADLLLAIFGRERRELALPVWPTRLDRNVGLALGVARGEERGDEASGAVGLG